VKILNLYKTVLLFFLLPFCGCKARLPIETIPLTKSDSEKTTGIVSHEFYKNGCETVIIIKNDSGDLILSPIEKLDTKFDIEGLQINFNYKLSKRPKSNNCLEGLPAFLSEIGIIKTKKP
jgi:hypothetical protein